MNSGKKPLSPIFIVGSPRSGTTLMRFVLSSHPNIYIPDETGFIPYLLKPSRVKDFLSQAEVANILKRIGKLNYLWRDLVFDIPAFYQSLPEPNITNILDRLYQQVVVEYDAVRWGDKTPLYVRHILMIAKIFPNAQFIHVIRDGRDATLSAQGKWGISEYIYMDNYYLLKNWVVNVSTGRKQGALLNNNQYLEIKYEDLVKEPENSIRQICKFLQEGYNSNMLLHYNLARRVGSGQDDHFEVMQPISTNSVGRWRAQMSGFEKIMSDRIAGSLLANLGYERSKTASFNKIELGQYALFTLKYYIAETIRELFYRLGIFTINRRMRR